MGIRPPKMVGERVKQVGERNMEAKLWFSGFMFCFTLHQEPGLNEFVLRYSMLESFNRFVIFIYFGSFGQDFGGWKTTPNA